MEATMLDYHTQEAIFVRKYRKFAKKLVIFLAGIAVGILLISLFVWGVQRDWDYNLAQYDQYYIDIPAK